MTHSTISFFQAVFQAIRTIRTIRATRFVAVVGAAFLIHGCAVKPQQQVDNTAFRESRPRSILVMPPANQSPEVKAHASFLSTATAPLAESGYYVIPVTLSEETFKQNGVYTAEDAHAISPAKLREIFGADAALYITVTRFGTSYRLLESVVEAVASARLVDLRSGQELWQGKANVVLGQNNNSGGLVSMLLNAAVNQIANTIADSSHDAARMASQQILSAGRRNGILFGPYHPRFGTD